MPKGNVAAKKRATRKPRNAPPTTGSAGLDMSRMWRTPGTDAKAERRSCSFTDLPPDVQDELGPQAPDAKLWVKQLPLGHLDDGYLGRSSSDDEGWIDPMVLLQNVIDETVEESNFGLPDLKINQLQASRFAWWLYDWLGAKGIQERLSTMTKRYANTKKKSD